MRLHSPCPTGCGPAALRDQERTAPGPSELWRRGSPPKNSAKLLKNIWYKPRTSTSTTICPTTFMSLGTAVTRDERARPDNSNLWRARYRPNVQRRPLKLHYCFLPVRNVRLRPIADIPGKRMLAARGFLVSCAGARPGRPPRLADFLHPIGDPIRIFPAPIRRVANAGLTERRRTCFRPTAEPNSR